MSRSASREEESIDDIKTSLSRIEKLLNRGHQLLYGPEGEDPEPSTPDDLSHTVGAAAECPVAVAAAALSPTPAAPRRLSLERSAVSTPAATPQPHTRQARGTGQRPPWGKNNEALERSMRRVRRVGKKARVLEEGIDDDDVPQDISLEDLKARIHRELEEYHRNGPLMLRRSSNARKRKSVSRVRTAHLSQRATPSTKVAASLAPPRKMTNHVTRTAAAAPCTRVTSRSSFGRSSVMTSQQHSRAPPKPSGRQPPRTAPATVRRAPTATAPPGTIWDRLYKDASEHQKKMKWHRDEILQEEREKIEKSRVKPTRLAHPPAKDSEWPLRQLQRPVTASSQCPTSSTRAAPGPRVNNQGPYRNFLHVSDPPQRNTEAERCSSSSRAQETAHSLTSAISADAVPSDCKGVAHIPTVITPLDLRSLKK